MEQYNDDERVDDLKKWWKDNGASIIAGIVLGLVAIFGWQYWNSYRDGRAEKASLAYDGFVEAVEQPDVEQARQRGQTLLTDFPNSSYTVLAALQLAKLEMDGNDSTAATQHLEWVIANARIVEFKDIARLRLARVLFTAGQPTEAEKLLEGVTTASMNAERDELKGDLYLAGGDLTKARAAYTAALAVRGGNPLLQLKLDNLTPTTAESVVAAPPPPPPLAAPSEPEETTEAAEAVEPVEPVEAVEPVEPVEAVEPVELLETTESVEPVEAPTLPPVDGPEAAPTPMPSPPAPGQ